VVGGRPPPRRDPPRGVAALAAGDTSFLTAPSGEREGTWPPRPKGTVGGAGPSSREEAAASRISASPALSDCGPGVLGRGGTDSLTPASGARPEASCSHNEPRGVPVTPPRAVDAVHPGETPHMRIGDWPTGLYFARLVARNGLVGFAPFVVCPHRLGEHRVAVVLPTLTWQAFTLAGSVRQPPVAAIMRTCGRG
jgi:hypothetical protein